MFNFRACAVLLLILLSAAVSSCLADGSRLEVGDVIAVSVDGEKEFSKSYQINDDGCIMLPMIDPVKVIGINTSEAAAVVTKALTEVLISPQVSVAFVERAKMQVFVVGQVQKPGPAEVGIGDRVIQALSRAIYDDTADLSRVTVRRGEQVINVDLTKYLSGDDLAVNIKLLSGDTVVVPRIDTIGTVLVLGQVAKVGSVSLRRGMTFREVMGFIGGATVEADTEKITIKRDSALEPIRVDYKRAMDGDPSADVALAPGDTIYVPQIETAFFTVMGGVNKPGQYPLKGKLTVSEAVGLAGGPAPHVGDMRKVQLMRANAVGTPSGETIDINLTNVIKTSAEEPLVNRGDVIYVAVHREKPSFLDILRSVLPFGWIFK